MIISGEIENQKLRAALCGMADVFFMPENKLLPRPLSRHIDMSVMKIGNKLFTCRAYFEAAKAQFDFLCKDAGIEIVIDEDLQGASYPQDAKFNAFSLGGKLFCNEKNISKVLLGYAKENGIEIKSVSQGYTKCSSLVFANCVISADGGICRAARECGFAVSEIAPGGISLPPYDCGFIGGASGVCGGKIIFFGDIALHPCGEEIIRFILQNKYDYSCLCGEKLFDVGGIIEI